MKGMMRLFATVASIFVLLVVCSSFQQDDRLSLERSFLKIKNVETCQSGENDLRESICRIKDQLADEHLKKEEQLHLTELLESISVELEKTVENKELWESIEVVKDENGGIKVRVTGSPEITRSAILLLGEVGNKRAIQVLVKNVDFHYYSPVSTKGAEKSSVKMLVKIGVPCLDTIIERAKDIEHKSNKVTSLNIWTVISQIEGGTKESITYIEEAINKESDIAKKSRLREMLEMWQKYVSGE